MNLEWETRPCPACSDTTERRLVVKSNIDVAKLTEFAFASRKRPEYMHPRMVECASCGLVYANPVLARATITEVYKEAAFDSGLESQFASRTYARLVEQQLSKLGNRTMALDIGAGDGSFMERLLDLDFQNVVGIEPSVAALAQAGPRVRSTIHNDIFQARDFELEQFDLITCFQVMEHVWGPAQLLRDVFSLLRPGGLLLTVVHDVNALSAKLLGTKSPIFDIEHLQLFSQKTIAELLLKVGFTEICVKSIWNRYPVQYWLRLTPLPHAIKNKLSGGSTHSRIGQVPCSLPAGNLVAVAWKPS